MQSKDPTVRLESFLHDFYLRRGRGIVPGLEAIQSLLQVLGNPQQAFPAIHVAGTNGKGSVCAMVESVLREAGLKTGLYTSPHLVRFNERIRVQGEEIDDAELDRLLHRLDLFADDVGKQVRPPTFFECTTALAMQYFAQQQVDVAVIETGMGGRWDATNVLRSLVTVVTSVGLDHMAYLGDSAEKIALEKCGIAKPGIPLVSGVTEEPVCRVIEEEAHRIGAPVVHVQDQISVCRGQMTWAGQRLLVESGSETYPPIDLPLLGVHQVHNCAVAIATLEAFAVRAEMKLDRTTVTAGLGQANWPGRMHILSNNPLVVVDAAHNPDGARVLKQSMKELAPEKPMALVAGFLREKDAVGFLQEWVDSASRAWLVPMQVERSMDTVELEDAGMRAGVEPHVCTLETGLARARDWAEQHAGVVLVTGSVYLVGEVLGLGR